MAVSVVLATRLDSTANPAVTASFSVALNDVVALPWIYDANGGATVLTPTKSAGTATVAAFVDVIEQESGGAAGMLYLLVTAGGTLTLSIDKSGSTDTTRRLVVTPHVLTGCDTADIVGVTGSGASASNSFTTTGVTSEQTGSLLIWAANEWNDLGTPTSSDLGNVDAGNGGGGSMSFITGTKAGTASSQTANLDAAGGGGADWDYVVVEFRASAAAADAPRQNVYVRPHAAVHRSSNW